MCVCVALSLCVYTHTSPHTYVGECARVSDPHPSRSIAQTSDLLTLCDASDDSGDRRTTQLTALGGPRAMASSTARARALPAKGATTIYDSYPLSLRTFFMARDGPPLQVPSRSHVLEELTHTARTGGAPGDEFLSTLHDTSSSMDSAVSDSHDTMVPSSSESSSQCVCVFVLESVAC